MMATVQVVLRGSGEGMASSRKVMDDDYVNDFNGRTTSVMQLCHRSP